MAYYTFKVIDAVNDIVELFDQRHYVMNQSKDRIWWILKMNTPYFNILDSDEYLLYDGSDLQMVKKVGDRYRPSSGWSYPNTPSVMRNAEEAISEYCKDL